MKKAPEEASGALDDGLSRSYLLGAGALLPENSVAVP